MKLFFILSIGLSVALEARAFDSKIIIQCDSDRIEIFDNLGNGKPKISAVFAIVESKDGNEILSSSEFSYSARRDFVIFERQGSEKIKCDLISEIYF